MKVKKIICCSAEYRVLVLFIAGCILFYRCDEPQLPPGGIPFSERYNSVTVQFNKNFENVAEGAEVMLLLTFDKAPMQNMKLELDVETNGIFNHHFITDPVIENDHMFVFVSSGQASVSIKFKSLNNTTFDEGKYIVLRLRTGENIYLGRNHELTLIIEDDEAPSIASFAVNKGSVNELDTGGANVQVLLSAPAIAPGKIFIRSTQSFTDFVTDAPFSENVLELEVNKGDTSVGFNVFPIYNTSCSDKSVLFTIMACFGVVKSGADNVYGLTIKNNGDTTTIGIAGNTGTLNESNLSGILLHIDIVPMAKEDNYLYLNVSGNEISNRFYTSPPIEGDSFDGYFVRIPVPRNATRVDVKIIPVNDKLKNGNHQVDFSLYKSNLGPCVKINTTSAYHLTIMDDD